MSNNNDNLENKPQVNQSVALAAGNKIKRVLAGRTGSKLKSVVALGRAHANKNKIKRVLDGLKLSNISKRNTTKRIISISEEQKTLPKIVGDIRHYPPANKE